MEVWEMKQRLAERYPQWQPMLEALSVTNSLEVDPAANDGRAVVYNSRRFQFYTPDVQCFRLAQQVLHVQLAHTPRGAGKDPALWARATEAVVNALLQADGVQLPPDAFTLPYAAGQSAESVYVRLAAETPPEDAPDADAVPEPQPKKKELATGESAAQRRGLSEEIVADAVAGLAEYLQPSTDVDYDWFPGTTIRHGMLRDEFRPYRVARAEVLIDTSRSVDEPLLRTFLRGVKALLQDALLRVGCFDTRFYGFQDVATAADIDALALEGGGGTDFNVAVNAFTGDAENQILFTDGYGEMPRRRCDAVWVVHGTMRVAPPGGRVLYVNPFEKTYGKRRAADSFAAEAREWISI